MDLSSLLGTTKSIVFNHLITKKRTAREVAVKLDIQLNAARKHLESLKSKGLVKEEYIVSGVGRPKKYYTVSGEGREIFQNQSASVLNLVLVESLKKNGKQNVDEIMREVAREIGSPITDLEKTNKIEHLADLLDKLGFETSLREREDSYEIISVHCPLEQTATSHQKLVCNGLHSQIIKSALGTDEVNLGECMALGGSVCRHVLPK